jgi:tetratricopeptide (TPR) repeat protein
MDTAEALYKRALEADPKHAAGHGSYAIFLSQVRKDMNAAEIHHRRAIEANPVNNDELGNYAQILLGLGRREEGLAIIDQLLNGNTTLSDALHIELLIYRYAHDPANRDRALAALKTALEKGDPTQGWSFAVTLDRAAKDAHPNMELLADITNVANGSAAISTLDKHPAWRAA